MSTIAERRKADLQKHRFALTKLALFCGVDAPDGEKLRRKLLRIEKEGMVQVVNRINGIITRAQFDQYEIEYTDKVQALFNNKLEGLLIDDNGYHMLKIESEFMQPPKGKYRAMGLWTDLGGYGLLAPEIIKL